MDYTTFSERNFSTKLTLLWIEPSQRLLLWTLDSGAIYKKTVSYFVIDISVNGTSLSEASSPTLSAGEWFFDSEAGEVYIRLSDSSDPEESLVVATYRKFYGDAPVILPYDLLNGAPVEYEGRVLGQPSIRQSLDEEQVGIALDSKTSIKLNNADGHFDEFIDVLFFENKPVKIYSWSPSIPFSEKKLIFRGVIEDKEVSIEEVGFRVADEIFKLREPINISLFSDSDGSISDTYLDTPKRRIYGQVEKLQCVPIDSVLGGYSLTGTVSGNSGSVVITGSGTNFLDEVSPEDELTLITEFEDLKLTVKSVDSDTQITLSDELEVNFVGQSLTNSPARPYRKKNRNWHIAGHKLRAPSTTVTASSQANRFTVDDSSDFFAGDLISVDGESAFIKRISGNNIVLTANLQGGTPSVSDVVSKNPLSKAFINTKEAFINRDWTVANGVNDAILVLENDAEFNLAPAIDLDGSITFTNGSREVTATGVNFLDDLQPRDWIRSDDLAHTTWYEILSVEQTTIYLRTAYAGGTTTGGGQRKNPVLVDDDSLITVNCIGYESNGVWLRTASDAVKHLLESDLGTTDLNTQSFTDTKEEMPYTLSYIFPKRIGDPKTQTIKSAISEINASVFGSLVFDDDWNYKYMVVSTERPTDMIEIKDDDFVGDYRVSTKNNIVRKINARYRPFVDIFTAEDTFKFYEYENDFVDSYIGIKTEKDIDLFLFNEADAQRIAQRYAFHNALSQSVVTIRGKLNISFKQLGQKVSLNLDRLYKRFGNLSRRKVVSVNSFTRNGNGGELKLIDLGNAYNRNPAIASNTAAEFTSAGEDEKILNGYIVDNDLEVPNTSSEIELFSQVIG